MFNSWGKRAKNFAAVIFYTGSALSVLFGVLAVCGGHWTLGLLRAVSGVIFSFFESLTVFRLGSLLDGTSRLSSKRCSSAALRRK